MTGQASRVVKQQVRHAALHGVYQLCTALKAVRSSPDQALGRNEHPPCLACIQAYAPEPLISLIFCPEMGGCTELRRLAQGP